MAGCDEIWGAAATVKIALALSTLPAVLLTVTVKVAPLSALVVAGVMYDALVAPVTDAPSLFH